MTFSAVLYYPTEHCTLIGSIELRQNMRGIKGCVIGSQILAQKNNNKSFGFLFYFSSNSSKPIKTVKDQDFNYFAIKFGFIMGSTIKDHNRLAIVDYVDSYFKLKPPDCRLFSQDGCQISIHKV